MTLSTAEGGFSQNGVLANRVRRRHPVSCDSTIIYPKVTLVKPTLSTNYLWPEC